MQKHYYAQRNCLVYIGNEASSDFWDDQWRDAAQTRRRASRGSKRAWVIGITRKYLAPDIGMIIEGGCGLGDKVDSFAQAGYQCIGIDFAAKTVEHVKQMNPGLDVRIGDVKHLDFPDNTFAGYWSLGVIEHFWQGFDDIGREMYRVLKPGGYLFLTFPFMNMDRKSNSRSRYPELAQNEAPDGFYQFALDPDWVTSNFVGYGFQLVKRNGFSVLHGLKEEFASFAGPIGFVLKHKNRNTLTAVAYRVMNGILDKAFGNRYGHSVLLVMKKI